MNLMSDCGTVSRAVASDTGGPWYLVQLQFYLVSIIYEKTQINQLIKFKFLKVV